MNRHLSLYLDAMRGSAALLVFFSHLAWKQLSGGALWMLIPLGHDAVMVFFVMSGFVIQHVTQARAQTGHAYAVARVARLYSVILPALLLTLVCDFVGQARLPQLYPADTWSQPWWRVWVVLSMQAQNWNGHTVAFSNDPFWSLPYEAWYYVMFGLWCFVRGPGRWLALGLCLLWVGPPILMYLPIWLMGVWACVAVTRWPLAPRRATVHAVVTAVLLGGVAALDLAKWVPRSTQPGWPHNFALIDYATGLLVAVHIHAVAHLQRSWTWPAALVWFIKWVASWSFTLYLFHMPLLKVTRTFLPEQMPAEMKAVLMTLVVMAVVIPASRLAERHKASLQHVLGQWRVRWPVRKPSDTR